MRSDAGLLQELMEKVQHNNATREELRLLLQLLEEKKHHHVMPYEEWLQSDGQQLSPGLKHRVMKAALHKNTTGIQHYIRRWLPYAAVILMLLAIRLFLPGPWKHQPAYVTIAANDGEIKRIVLPDSSVVTLNARSEIRFQQGGKSNSRDVFLDGEAFFEIHPDNNKPFIVHTDGMQTQVLGTSFNIKYYPGEKLMVGVLTGKVKVTAAEGKSTVLQRGEKTIYNPSAGVFTSINEEPQEMNAWQQGIINMNNLTLEEVATVLERWYSVKIILESPGIAKHILSGSQNNTSLEASLNAICFVYNLGYHQQGNVVHIYKK